MNTKLDWTQKLGDAVLAQQPDVMASVQRLRQQADAAGNLKSSEQVKVVKESETIYIEPASPQVIYVPQYSPTVIYGTWPYPAYPPYYYPPPPAYMYPGYTAAAAWVGFGVGVAITAAVWNNNWGHYHNDYHGGSINIDNSTNIGGGNIMAITTGPAAVTDQVMAIGRETVANGSTSQSIARAQNTVTQAHARNTVVNVARPLQPMIFVGATT